MALDAIQGGQMDFNLFTVNTQDGNGSLVQSLSASVSKLDLKAPGKAQREYAKGYQLLMHKDWQGAIATWELRPDIYPILWRHIMPWAPPTWAWIKTNRREMSSTKPLRSTTTFPIPI